MSDRELILTLGKVIVAAAWADCEITNDEINSLKDLLYRLPHAGPARGLQITDREWATLEMYIASPVDAAERARLVEQLQQLLRRPADKELAMMALEEIVNADDGPSEEEQRVVNEIKAAIDTVDVSIFGQLGRLVGGAIQRRSDATVDAPNREEHFDDFIRNRVYYAVQQRLNMGTTQLNIPDADLRKLSLSGGLMARIAHVDRKITEGECDKIINALEEHWELSHESATFVGQVAVSAVSLDMDYFRMTREFFSVTGEAERLHLLDALFDVAAADDYVTNDEIEEIRRIADSLNMSRTQFIDAKVKIPRELRAS